MSTTTSCSSSSPSSVTRLPSPDKREKPGALGVAAVAVGALVGRGVGVDGGGVGVGVLSWDRTGGLAAGEGASGCV